MQRWLFTALIMIITVPATGQQTQSYRYDSLGRLAGATTSGGARDGVTTTINHDAAGNRTSYKISGINYVQNPGFETGDKTAWSVWSGNSTQGASYVEGGGSSGKYRLTHYSSAPYQVYTSQTILGILNGNYTLTARVVGGGGQTAAYLSVKQLDGSGAERTADVLGSQAGWPNFNSVNIISIQVQNNQIIVGLYSLDTFGGHWLSIEDFRSVSH